jgi:hypothetical protein
VVNDLVPISKETLTPAQFAQLADVPPELEWLGNITNPKTRRGPHPFAGVAEGGSRSYRRPKACRIGPLVVSHALRERRAQSMGHPANNPQLTKVGDIRHRTSTGLVV